MKYVDKIEYSVNNSTKFPLRNTYYINNQNNFYLVNVVVCKIRIKWLLCYKNFRPDTLGALNRGYKFTIWGIGDRFQRTCTANCLLQIFSGFQPPGFIFSVEGYSLMKVPEPTMVLLPVLTTLMT